MIAAARLAAYEILRAVGVTRADLPTATDTVRERLADARDRALATDVATGVLRHRAALDFLIEHYSGRPVQRLDAEVLEILRLSAYQLLHLTRVPASAVVDDGVKLARHVRKASASGLVNAVLRTLSRHRHALPLPSRPVDEADRQAALTYCTTTLSHPRWLVERWLDRFGFERTEAWLLFNNQHPPLTLRANRRVTTVAALEAKLRSLGVETTRATYAPDALLVGRPYDVSAVQSVSESVVMQDEASQLVPLLAGVGPLARVLDACASPGGKTVALATTAAAEGVVVACDVRERRVRLLRQVLTNAGVTNARIVQADFRCEPPFLASFDCVLVDAPCSGLGVLRREPDIKWRRLDSDLQRFAEAQLALLQRAAQVVAVGGRLIYATCSSEPVENEAVAAHFLASAPTFVPIDARSCHPSLPDTVVDQDGHLRTEPDHHGLEAFFGAVFERRSDAAA